MAQEDELASLGTEMAQRKIIACLAEFARISLQNASESMSGQMVKDLESRLSELKGEYLYSAPPELAPELAKVVNSSFQQTFSELSSKVIEHLRKP